MTSCHSLTRNTSVLLLLKMWYHMQFRACQMQCEERKLVPVADVKMKILLDYFKMIIRQISRHRLIYLLPFWITDYHPGWRVESISLNQMSVSQSICHC